jgi:AraC-like DNA-binding protein
MNNLINIGRMANCRSFNSHAHDVWEMIYYSKGEVMLTIGDRKHFLAEGAFVCQPPGIRHSEIGMDAFDNYFFSVASYDILPPKKILVQDTSNEAIGNQIKQMYFAYNARPPNYQMVCEAHLNAIVQYVMSQLKSSPVINPYIDLFVRDLVLNASNCDFKISNLKNKIPYSPDYFRLLFKKAVGCTPKEYLNNIRINNAKGLLGCKHFGSGLSISNIAVMSGFSDPLYFSRCFKKNTGVSPSDWVKKKV